ncbi:MAG: DUF2851 family protein, partial [Chloroflexi bacterium]|nr:DUF2851 family protein [Chloroflexota bacterium]
LARRWWQLPLGSKLPLSNGAAYQLLFAGCPGGSAGPDVRDAVLAVVSPQRSLLDNGRSQDILTEKRVGDVEFHVRSSDWITHQHDIDPRYNSVILHVVLLCDDPHPTMRQDGSAIPVCSLYDLPMIVPLPSASSTAQPESGWLCHEVMPLLSATERNSLLKQAGLLRFEQKAHAFVEQIHGLSPGTAYEMRDAYDTCLIPALAEGLGYGRDREFFRAVGLYLLNMTDGLPEPLGRSAQPDPLDAKRLCVLSTLVKQWSDQGVWQTLRELLLPPLPTPATTLLQALRTAFCNLGLSLARADILICNVVLPFASAVALLECDGLLAERAQALYLMHPGLPSNRITRIMCMQLRLQKEPQGSCQQQGLHYIYQQTCREKRCEVCMVGKRSI